MPKAYGARDQLAILMTGYPSLRAAARAVGVTHQKLGRWLREGEPGGVKAIPSDLFTRAAIQSAYDDHAARARERAKALGVPLRADAPPVMPQRRELSSVETAPRLSDRVTINTAQFLGPELRAQVLKSFARTGEFVGVSVRSKISIIDYMREKYAALWMAGRLPGKTKRDMQRMARKAAEGFALQRGDVNENGDADLRADMAMYTSRDTMKKGADISLTVSSIEAKLTNKHAPAVYVNGRQLPRTALGDQISMQLLPEQSAAERIAEAQKARNRAAARARRAGSVKGRGPK